MRASVVAYVVLAFAVCSVWIPRSRANSAPSFLWVPLLALAVCIALLARVLEASGAAAISTLALLAILAGANFVGRWWRLACAVVTFALAFAIALNRIPGFSNATYVLGAEGARPVQFNVGAAGLILLGTLARPTVSGPRGEHFVVAMRRAAIPAVLTITAPVAAAMAIGVARLTFNLPHNTVIYLVSNLLFTCVAEEAAFRGVLQRVLSIKFGSDFRTLRGWIPLIISTLLFALAHAAGGPLAILLVAIAGFGYGITYSIAQRLEPSILVHFLLNAVVFVFLKLAR